MVGKQIVKGIENNVLVLGVVSFLTDVSSEMIFPLISVFLTAILGAGKEIVGIIEGIADSITSIVEILSGYFSDKKGKRKQFVTFGYGLSSFAKAGIAISTAWWHVLIARALERVGKGIRTAPRDAIIAASAESSVRGKAYGLHRAMDTLGAIVGPAIAYFLLSQFGSTETGYRTVFTAAILPAFLAVVVLLLFVREPEKAKTTREKFSFWQTLREMSPQYKTFLKISLFFSLAYFSFAFFILRAYESGIRAEDVLLLYIVYNIAYASAAIPVGSLSDIIGRKPVIAGAFALYALICAGFVFASEWLHFAALFAIYGVFVAADESVNKAFIADLSTEEKRGTAMGAYNTAIGAAYLPASAIAGTLWAMYGVSVPFFLAAGIGLLSAAAMIILL